MTYQKSPEQPADPEPAQPLPEHGPDWMPYEPPARTIFCGAEPTNPAEFEMLESRGFHDLANFWHWRQKQQLAPLSKVDNLSRSELLALLNVKIEPKADIEVPSYSAEHLAEFRAFDATL